MFSGYVKTSLVDYPQHICSTLFTQGCNFACYWCHNKHLLRNGEGSLSENIILHDLISRQHIIDAVCITGGEPSLWGGKLVAFMEKIKASSPLLIKLDTNGSNPSFVETCLKKKIVDLVAIDIKEDISDPLSYTRSIGIQADSIIPKIIETIHLIQSYNIPLILRTTMIDSITLEKLKKNESLLKHPIIPQQYIPRNLEKIQQSSKFD